MISPFREASASAAGRAGSRVRNFALMKILSAMFVPPEHEIRAARAAAPAKAAHLRWVMGHLPLLYI